MDFSYMFVNPGQNTADSTSATPDLFKIMGYQEKLMKIGVLGLLSHLLSLYAQENHLSLCTVVFYP